jgi:hypothetical protein
MELRSVVRPGLLWHAPEIGLPDASDDRAPPRQESDIEVPVAHEEIVSRVKACAGPVRHLDEVPRFAPRRGGVGDHQHQAQDVVRFRDEAARGGKPVAFGRPEHLDDQARMWVWGIAGGETQTDEIASFKRSRHVPRHRGPSRSGALAFQDIHQVVRQDAAMPTQDRPAFDGSDRREVTQAGRRLEGFVGPRAVARAEGASGGRACQKSEHPTHYWCTDREHIIRLCRLRDILREGPGRKICASRVVRGASPASPAGIVSSAAATIPGGGGSRRGSPAPGLKTGL